MSKSIKVAARVRLNDENGNKIGTTSVQTEVPLKNLDRISTGNPSDMNGKLSFPVRTTVLHMNDGSQIIAFATKNDVFQTIKKVATSGKNQEVPSTIPAPTVNDADVVDALVGAATAEEN